MNITNICKLRCRSFSWWGSGAKSASLLGRKSLQSSIFHFSTSKSAQIHRLMAPPFQIFRPSPREANLCVLWMSLLFICTSFAMRPIDSPSIPEHWRDLETNSKTFKLVESKWVNLQQESREMQGTTGFRAFPKICFLKMSRSFNSCNGRVTSKMVIHHPIERCPI